MEQIRALKSIPLLALISVLFTTAAHTQSMPGVDAQHRTDTPDLGGADRILPATLERELRSQHAPTVLYVGPRELYTQAHVHGAVFVGQAGTPAGRAALQQLAQTLPRASSLVVYCGCCPWGRCPNIRPAFLQLHALGFKHLRALYLPNNFGVDWVQAGLPTDKGAPGTQSLVHGSGG